MTEVIVSGLIALGLTFLIDETFFRWVESNFRSGGDNS